MNSRQPLQQTSILVTRPRHQAEPFCQQLEQLGARVYRLPVIEIQPIQPETSLLTPSKPYDILIFTSSNAVQGARNALHKVYTPGCKIAAIGKKTAQVLEQSGIPVDLQPSKNFNSESLLALPAFQHVEKKHLLLIKGEGGRQYLQKTLTARGANIQCMPVYRRRKPEPDQSLLSKLESTKIDIITLTSAESGVNLFSFLDNKHYPWLPTATLLLGSQRIQTALSDRNLKNPIKVANNPSDHAMLAALLDLI